MAGRFAAVVVLAAVVIGCAGSAWRRARSEDTVLAYHRFLKEFPDSHFSEEARARVELARVRNHPTRAAFEAFRERYGNPALLAELKPFVEESFFRRARAIGTGESYREFLGQFPSGKFVERARGNLEYLENEGFSEDLEALAAFATRYPDSDYAIEADRSVQSVRQREASGFQRVGLLVEVETSTPGGDRVARVFRDRAGAAYAAAGIEIATLSTIQDAREMGLTAVLRIQHEEREKSTQLEEGHVVEPAVVARTIVTLQRVADRTPIWSDTFEYRAPLSARRRDVSILFGPGSLSSYWADLDGDFFVPVARWNTRITARTPHTFSKPPVAIDVSESRAVALFGDGDFQLVDLGNPSELTLLSEYRRERDLATFAGVTLEGSQVAVFGADGVEIVRLDGEESRRESRFGRDTVGSAVDVERIGNEWLAATNRGLLLLGGDPASVRVLVPRQIFGMDRSGDRIVFTDGISLYVATVPLLRAGRVESELRLGRGFNPRRVRAKEQTAVVLGERDAVWVDLRSSPPRLRSRIGGTESGRVLDAAVIRNRLFLLGQRGLQVADVSGERIIDSVDVVPRKRVDVAGRHLVMIGASSLQVVDATPFVTSAAASRDR